ncbi:hypothetical protein IVA80_24585 [Bradyrhizobium sp. 139]|uniref:hypothetical protein n=1 Tax=Bradyrhizobium sp. 139 TaxID=2782616 RepID=UPI001FFBC5A4|nr:hypothetical protein [Bradyrhizobium sp. 139]MCK1743929.1 hypothetical protein [Bradyrhizobium sp. 139]
MSGPLQIGLLVFPRVTQLDLTAPAQVFSVRVCIDRNCITGGGITAGIDFALTLVSMLRSRVAAEMIQLRMEYNPAPPFAAGSPDTASPAIVAAMKERVALAQARRLAFVRKAVGRRR